jgi:hypothetical protein
VQIRGDAETLGGWPAVTGAKRFPSERQWREYQAVTTAINTEGTQDKDLQTTFSEAQERFVYAEDATLQGIYLKLRLLTQVESLAGLERVPTFCGRASSMSSMSAMLCKSWSSALMWFCSISNATACSVHSVSVGAVMRAPLSNACWLLKATERLQVPQDGDGRAGRRGEKKAGDDHRDLKAHRQARAYKLTQIVLTAAMQQQQLVEEQMAAFLAPAPKLAERLARWQAEATA